MAARGDGSEIPEINETGIEIISTDLRARARPRRLLRDEMLFKVEELITEICEKKQKLFILCCVFFGEQNCNEKNLVTQQ